MLHLSREEASLVEVLRREKQSLGDVARLLASDPESVRMLIHRVNRTAGHEIVHVEMLSEGTVCSLTEDVGSYQVLSGVRETLGEVAAMHHQTNWKLVLLYFIGTMTFGVVTFFLGYYMGTLSGGLTMNVDEAHLKDIINHACSLKQ